MVTLYIDSRGKLVARGGTAGQRKHALDMIQKWATDTARKYLEGEGLLQPKKKRKRDRKGR